MFTETKKKEKYTAEGIGLSYNQGNKLITKDIENYACADIFYPQRYFMTNFDGFPSKLILNTSVDYFDKHKDVKYLQFQLKKFIKTMNKTHDVRVISDCDINENNELSREQFYVIIEDEQLIFYIEPTPARCVIYHNNYIKAQKWAKILYKYQNALLNENVIKRKVGIIYKTQAGYNIMERDIKHYEVDLDENYNDDFIKSEKTIRNFLEEDDKGGLVILNGVAGSGKSTYIRNLIDTVARDFIFLTKDMASALADPEFILFLDKLKNSVLIIEDCESLVASREQGNSGLGIANVLNLCDGILGDIYNVKIICTFNTEIKNVDDALLRAGRLVCRYQFGKLCREKARTLLTKLGVDENYEVDENGMTLADIYNYGKENGGTQSKKNKIFGFGE